MIVRKCTSFRDFNVFGVDDIGCCYCHMKYCKDVPPTECIIKQLVLEFPALWGRLGAEE